MIKHDFKYFMLSLGGLAFALVLGIGCQKLDRPALGDYARDSNPPGGPLSFFVAFDGTTTNPLMNAVDSIRATFPTANPLASVDGVRGKGVKGDAAKEKAIQYARANDFASATSFSVAYWLKNVPATDGEPEFHFSLVSKDYWHESGLFLLVEKGGPNADNSTANLMACTFAVEDHWIEFRGEKRLPKVLDGSWHHLVFTYDEKDSRVRVYVDGALAQTSDPVMKGGAPRGARPFSNATTFVLGGWNKHGNAGGAGDPWIHAFSGTMDQFRLYRKPLALTEIQALFNSKM